MIQRCTPVAMETSHHLGATLANSATTLRVAVQ